MKTKTITHGSRHLRSWGKRHYRDLKHSDDETLGKRRPELGEEDIEYDQQKWRCGCADCCPDSFWGASVVSARMVLALLKGPALGTDSAKNKLFEPLQRLARELPVGDRPSRPEDRLPVAMSDAFLAELQGHFTILGQRVKQVREVIRASDAELEWLNALTRMNGNRGLQDSHEAIASILTLEPFWIRSPCDWQPKRDFDDQDFASLVRHLFEVYPIPAPLLSREAWLNQECLTTHSIKWQLWAVIIGRGASMKRAGQLFGWWWHSGLMEPLFREGAKALPPSMACQWAEAIRRGASETLAHAWLGYRGFLLDPTAPPWEGRTAHSPPRDFGLETLAWIMRHEVALPPERFTEVFDWANHRFTEGQRGSGSPFQWKGRSPASVLRMAAEYREEIRLTEERARAERQQRLAGQPVTWHSHGWDWQCTEENDIVWSAHELLSRHDLAEEGCAMHHCVVMYAERCVQGQCAIFSIRRNGSRVLTVELELPGRKLCQIRGSYNRAATELELQIVSRWTVEMETAITAH